VNLKKDGKFFLATFPDIPEAITQGETREEALHAAQEALETALDFYFASSARFPPHRNLSLGNTASSFCRASPRRWFS
jgi:predicted RNase H-like HicB family nuclease